MITKDKAEALASKLLKKYLELGGQANMAKKGLAELAGASQSRFYQMAKAAEKGEPVTMDAFVFLRIREASRQLETDLGEGTLPLKSKSQGLQKNYLEQLGVGSEED